MTTSQQKLVEKVEERLDNIQKDVHELSKELAKFSTLQETFFKSTLDRIQKVENDIEHIHKEVALSKKVFVLLIMYFCVTDGHQLVQWIAQLIK